MLPLKEGIDKDKAIHDLVEVITTLVNLSPKNFLSKSIVENFGKPEMKFMLIRSYVEDTLNGILQNKITISDEKTKKEKKAS